MWSVIHRAKDEGKYPGSRRARQFLTHRKDQIEHRTGNPAHIPLFVLQSVMTRSVNLRVFQCHRTIHLPLLCPITGSVDLPGGGRQPRACRAHVRNGQFSLGGASTSAARLDDFDGASLSRLTCNHTCMSSSGCSGVPEIRESETLNPPAAARRHGSAPAGPLC